MEVPSSAPPSEAFRVIVPIDLSKVFRRWGPFPAVLGVIGQTGAWDTAGHVRFPQLSDGSTAREMLTEYTAPHSFAYEISEFTNTLGRLVDKIRGEWTMTPDGDGSIIRWTYSFYPRRGRRGVVRVFLVPLWRRYAAGTLRATVDYVEAPATAGT